MEGKTNVICEVQIGKHFFGVSAGFSRSEGEAQILLRPCFPRSVVDYDNGQERSQSVAL